MLPPLFTEELDDVAGLDEELELLHAAMPVRQAMARRAMPPLLLENLIVARRPSPRPGLSQDMRRSLVP
jgi:hypothetical protein